MLWKRIKRFWKLGFIVIEAFIVLSVLGCKDDRKTKNAVKDESKIQISQADEQRKAEKVIECCYQNYKEAMEEDSIAELEVIRSIVNQLGENGYAAVDSKNQIDMTNADQVILFCEKADKKEEAALTIIEVTYLGEFIKYDLNTKYGNVDIVRSYYRYENGNMKNVITDYYPADDWNYTEDGYLMFSGVRDSDDSYVLTLDEAEEHTAFRVLPLDETCRTLTRQYLIPFGYEYNNMFLVDWNEDDFGELNFYDLYDILYPKINAQSIPYTADENLGVGAVYRIPKAEFEQVIMSYFNIDSETLQSKTMYHPEDETYEYRPRGFYETEYPYYPYPEVVHYTENSDGTITLIVNVVFPHADISKVYTHEVVVRLLDGGGVQYVSNRILSSVKDYEKNWYKPRLTEEEWKEIYEGYHIPIDDMEREEAEADCQRVMEEGKVNETECLVHTGVPYSNMEHYEIMDDFLKNCLNGKSGLAVVYEIYSDGGIGRKKYIYDGINMYLLGINAVWNKENRVEIAYISYTRIKDWKYTDKGWFGYELCVPKPPEVTEIVDGSSLIRIKPMTEEEQELSKRCVYGLGYQGNNLLCSDWNEDNMEKLDYNGMYEYLYEMKYGEKMNPEKYSDGIPKEEFENLIMEYLPITAEELQAYAVFDEGSQTYEWVRLGCCNYAPTFFGTSLPEVTHIKENEDGTVTLTVEAVCDMVLCDDAVITSALVVKFADDGSFRYLGNKILDNGKEHIPDYQYRIVNEEK